MIPAPYKVSNPKAGERVKPVDGIALRKESWILGQCPDTFNTTNSATFRSPSMDTIQLNKTSEAAKALRAKVSGTSIKNECPSDAMTGTMYKTNSSVVHRDPGQTEVMD